MCARTCDHAREGRDVIHIYMKVNKEQASHFRKAVGHYQCTPEEVILMKAAYEADPEGAAICFAAIAFHVDLVTGPVAETERTITGEQFLKLGELSRELEPVDAQ